MISSSRWFKVVAIVLVIVLIGSITRIALHDHRVDSASVIATFLNFVAVIIASLFAGRRADDAAKHTEEIKEILQPEKERETGDGNE